MDSNKLKNIRLPHGIMFHHFHDKKLNKTGQGSITPFHFEKIIKFLLFNYNVLSPKEWINKSLKNSFKENDVCITFDDSLYCQYKIALKILNKYNFSSFVKLISLSGILVSITLFFLYGVEEIPYPEGAIVFHLEGLAKSFLLFFFSSVPLILSNNKFQSRSLASPSTMAADSKDTEYDKEKWEEASLEDVKSGDFETI